VGARKGVATAIQSRFENGSDRPGPKELWDWVQSHRGLTALGAGALLVVALLLAPLHVGTHPRVDQAEDGTPLFV